MKSMDLDLEMMIKMMMMIRTMIKIFYYVFFFYKKSIAFSLTFYIYTLLVWKTVEWWNVWRNEECIASRSEECQNIYEKARNGRIYEIQRNGENRHGQFYDHADCCSCKLVGLG